MKNNLLVNAQCLGNNFPWDWFLFLIIPLMGLWAYHIYTVNKLNEKLKRYSRNHKQPSVNTHPTIHTPPIHIVINTPNQKESQQTIVPASKIEPDDLKKIEGIGPKIEQLFYNEGIITYEQMVNMSTKDMKKILQKAGPSFQMHTPGTWGAQALLAKNEEFEELNKWQEILKGGKMI